MNANFFNQIAQLDITGVLQLNISKGAENNLVVSVMLHNEQCGDKAKQLIPPLNLRGTTEELDNGFFEQISTPLQTASGLMVDMEAFMKQLEVAKAQSAQAKEKAEKDKKTKDEKEKKYKEAMQKVDELEKDGKYRDAWMKLPDPALFPEQAEAIGKRRTSLSAKITPDLFGAAAEPPIQNTISDEHPDNEEAIEEEAEYMDDDNETA